MSIFSEAIKAGAETSRFYAQERERKERVRIRQEQRAEVTAVRAEERALRKQEKSIEQQDLKEERRLARRDDYIADAGKVSRQIGFMAQPLATPGKFKEIKKSSSIMGKAVAIDNSFEDDNPLKGIVEQTQSNINELASMPEAAHLSGKQLVDAAFQQSFDSRKDAAFAYKKKSEAGFFGFGGDEKGILPGYEEYLEQTPDAYEATKHAMTPSGMAGNFAMGAGLRVAGFAAAPLLSAAGLTTIGSALAIPTGGASLAVAAAIAAGAAFIPEMIAFDFANDVVQDTDWAKKNQVEGELDRTDLLGFVMGVGVAGAGRKAVIAGRNRFKTASVDLVEKSKLAKSAEAEVVKHTTSGRGNVTGQGPAATVLAMDAAKKEAKIAADKLTGMADDVMKPKPTKNVKDIKERVDGVLADPQKELGANGSRELEVELMAEREAARQSGVEFTSEAERKVVEDYLIVKGVEAERVLKESLPDVVKGSEIAQIPAGGPPSKIPKDLVKVDKVSSHNAMISDVSTNIDDIKAGNVSVGDTQKSVAAQMEVNAENASTSVEITKMAEHLGYSDEFNMIRDLQEVAKADVRSSAYKDLVGLNPKSNKNVGWIHEPAETAFDVAGPSQRLAALRKVSGSQFSTLKGFEHKAGKSSLTRELVYAADNAKVVEESAMKNSLTEVKHTSDLKAQSMKENAATASSKAGKLAVIMGSTIALGALSAISPDEAQAGVPDQVLRASGSVVLQFFRDFTPKAFIERAAISKEMAKKMERFVPKEIQGGRVYQPDTPDVLRAARKENLNLTSDLMRSGSGDGTLHRDVRGKLTLAQAFSDIYHDKWSPAVQFIGGLQHGNAISMVEQEVSLKHILNVKGINPGKARGIVSKKMKDVAQELSDIHVVMQDSGKLSRAMSETLEKGSHKDLSGDIKEMLVKAAREQSSIYETHVSKYKKVVAEKYDPILKDLAHELPETRIFMLLDGGTKKYPYLKDIVTRDEKAAAARLRLMTDDKAEVLKGVGVDTFSKDYVFHATHPDVDIMASIKKYPDLVKKIGQNKSIPFSRYHARAPHTVPTYPEISGTMEKYWPQTNKIIQTRKFMQSGWEDHMTYVNAHGTEAAKEAWSLLTKAMIPVDNTMANKIFNRMTSIEVARVLAGSTSVAFKHGMKAVGDVGVFGPAATLSTYSQAIRSAAINKSREGMFGRGMKILGVQAKSNQITDVIKTFSNQEKYRSVITEMGIDAVSMKKVDRIIDNVNDIGSLFVSTIEHVDRGVSTLASLLMASKKGMTPDQAGFAIWDAVLRTNFMAGANNPAWLKSPAIRFFMMFQGTPFKIAEQRVMNAIRASKDIKKASGLLVDDLKTLYEMRGTAEFGAKQIKWNLIQDALTADKDVFGTPQTQIFMRNILALGSVGAFSAVTGSHLLEQVVHPPFITKGEDTLNLSTNTVVQAGLKAYANREESDDMFFHRMYHKWAGGATPMPVMMKKSIRLVKGDIPDRYKGSKFAYLLGVAQSD